MTRTLAAVLAALLVVLAGCSGAVPGGSDGDAAHTTGTVNFYVSDEQNAIDDFEHLNVTITKVGFHEAGDEGDEGDANETATSEPTETNGTETEEAVGEAEDGGEEDRGDWEEFAVESRTVDLTELKGENATLLGEFELESGTYDKVFVYVSDVNGTLKNGERVNVKLPSERLHVNKRFTVEANESVDFVYDITVFKAGKSGKYILKPVVSESGTDVPIQEVGGDDGDDEDDERAGDLAAEFVGEVERGEAATVKVTRDGQPVENATVTVDGEQYRTGGDGTVTFDVPADAEELEVTVEFEDREVELKRTFDDDGQEGEQSTATPTPTPTET